MLNGVASSKIALSYVAQIDLGKYILLLTISVSKYLFC